MLRTGEIRSGVAMAWNDLSEDMQEYLERYKREFDEFSEDQEQRTSALGQQHFASPISNILSHISKGIAAARTPAQEAQRAERNRYVDRPYPALSLANR